MERKSAGVHLITSPGSYLYGHCYSQFSDGQNRYLAVFKSIMRTNLDINDTACLYVVHNLQHPSSCPLSRSTQNTMVNAPKIKVSPVLAGQYGKSRKRSTQQRHQADEEKSGLGAERVRALGALRSLRFIMKLL